MPPEAGDGTPQPPPTALRREDSDEIFLRVREALTHPDEERGLVNTRILFMSGEAAESSRLSWYDVPLELIGPWPKPLRPPTTDLDAEGLRGGVDSGASNGPASSEADDSRNHWLKFAYPVSRSPGMATVLVQEGAGLHLWGVNRVDLVWDGRWRIETVGRIYSVEP